MIEIEYDSDNYEQLQQLLALRMNTVVEDHLLRVPPFFGDGYVWAMNLSNGISVMLSDVSCNNELIFRRKEISHNLFYIIQFSECPEDARIAASLSKTQDAVFELHHNVVLMTSSHMPATYIVPAKVRQRSVKLILEKKHLLQYLEPEVLEDFLSGYFSQLVKTGNVELIDGDYRIWLDELLRQNMEHPLLYTYVTNRCMLLLECFLTKFMKRIEARQTSSRLKDDEINRLMRVEAQLMKDYTQPPPTIEVLSRLAAMSTTKLKKDFKELYGLPVYEYYQKNRMKYARSLLLEGRYSVKEVGTQVGYTNLSHFAGSFKKEFGVLPSVLTEKDLQDA